MSNIDSMIQETVSNVSNKTIDAMNDIIRKLHIFKLKMNEAKA